MIRVASVIAVTGPWLRAGESNQDRTEQFTTE